MPIEPITKVEPFDTLMKGIVELEILDSKSMLTHHKIMWDMLNISNHSNPGIEFDAGSLVPRTTEQLNIKVSGDNIDEKNIRVVLDEPNTKAFFIPFFTPHMPSERRKIIIEYDWEEPDRQYGYNFAQRYEEFTFRFVFPEGLKVNPAIHKMKVSGRPVKDTLQGGEKFNSSESGGRRLLEWHTTNVPPLTVSRFDW